MRFFRWFRRGDRERELAEELQSHLRLSADDWRERGHDGESAKAAARREFGNVQLVKENTRESWGPVWTVRCWADRAWQDIRFAGRMMRRSPGFAAVAVLTMALGIGANTAAFSLIDAALFSPEPYEQPRQLIEIKQIVLGDTLNTSPAEYLDYRDRNRVFQSLAGYTTDDYDLTGDREPQRITAVRATSELFRTLRVEPTWGHAFSSTEDVHGGPKVAVISYGFWQSYFGGNLRAALGSTIKLNESAYRVIGVMPAGFEFPASKNNLASVPALWIPMAFSPDEIADRAASYDVSAIARLKPGISIARAQADAERIVQQFKSEHPDIYTGNVQTRAVIEQLGSSTAASRRSALLLLGAGVTLLLLIACVNLASLLLARAGARQREITVRLALGAGLGLLARQLITEGIALTLCGGLLACVSAYVVLYIIGRFAPQQMFGTGTVQSSGLVLAFTLVLSIVTGIACGLAPIFEWARPAAMDALKQAGRGSTAGKSGRRMRSVLVVAEAALAVMLLIGAILLMRSFAAVLATPPGFDATGITVVRTSFNRARYPALAKRYNAERTIVERLQSIAGVKQVALTSHLPLADERVIGFIVEGRDPNEFHWADNALVDGSYFAAMKIPLRRGRSFDDRDLPSAPAAAVVNETMAREYWPHDDPLGKRILWGGRRLTIVGIVGDVHLAALDVRPKAMIYNSIYQIESGASTSAVFVIRAGAQVSNSPADVLRKAIWSVDPHLPVFSTSSMRAVVERSWAARRFTMMLLAVCAGLALLLAAVGLYGVLAYTVAQRTRELGVRLALGAHPARLLALTMAEGLRLTAIGVLGGVIGGIILAMAMSQLLFGIKPLDWLSFAFAAAILLLTAALASLIPALRAARVDPISALRFD